MKKLLLTVGIISAVAIPATSIISCGDSKKDPNNIPPAKTIPPVNPPKIVPPVTQLPTETKLPIIQPQNKIISPITTHIVDHTTKATTPTDTKPDVTNKDQEQLDDMIFDYRTDKSLSDAELNDAFSKYTTQIDFTGDPDEYGMLGMLTKPKVDRSRKMVKVMVVGTPNSNNGNVIFYAGILSYMNDATGNPMNGIYFTCIDFNEASKIEDHSIFGSKRFISVFNPAMDDKNILFALVPGINVDDLLSKLKTIADKEFPTT